MAEPTVAELLLAAARQDLLACEILAGTVEISDSVVGFHVQQAVEKSIKAVLAHRGVSFRRTHDIAELLDLLADESIDAPPNDDWLDELNPYGVEARYGLVSPAGLDRRRALDAGRAVWQWANERVNPSATP